MVLKIVIVDKHRNVEVLPKKCRCSKEVEGLLDNIAIPKTI